MSKKSILLICVIAVLVIALAALCLLFLNRGVCPDAESLYQYTVKERSTSVKVVLDRNGEDGYQWTAVSEGIHPLTVKDKSNGEKGIFVISRTEDAEGGFVRFQLKSTENSYDCLYEITLSFQVDEEDRLACIGYGKQEFLEKLEGGAAEGLPFFTAEDPDGGIIICFTSYPEGGGTWIPSVDAALNVEGPLFTEGENVLRFHVVAVYENGVPTPGTYEIVLTCRELEKELRMMITVDEYGGYSLSEAQVTDAEIAPTEMEMEAADFLAQYGQLSVLSGAEDPIYVCRDAWMLDDENEVEKKNARVSFSLDGFSWVLYLSDELSVNELTAEVKTLASASEKCTIGSVTGTRYTSDEFCAVAWRSGNRSYLLSVDSAGADALLAMAQRVAE